MMPFKVGQRVVACHDLYENDWWAMQWNEPYDPWHVAKGTEGTVIEFSPYPEMCVVDFDGGINGVVVCYKDDFDFHIEVKLTDSEREEVEREAQLRKARRFNDDRRYKKRLL